MINKDKELDLFDLGKYLLSKKLSIIISIGISIALGLVIAFTSKVEFTAYSKLLPEVNYEQDAGLGGLGGLAGLAGINVDLGGVGGLSPEIYPEIVYSLPFQNQLLNDSIYFQSLRQEISPKHFFEEIDQPSLVGLLTAYTLGLPSIIKSIFIKEDTTFLGVESKYIRLSKEEWKLVETFKSRIGINVDPRIGIITISIKMPDPVAAAEVASSVVTLLTEKVSDYKLQKQRTNLDFLSASLKKAKARYEYTQHQLALAVDSNKNINSSMVTNELDRLRNENDIAFSLYKGLATQVGQAEIKLNESIPVFTVLEPVRIPEDKSEPKRLFIVIGFCFMGLVLSSGFHITKYFLTITD